MDSTPKGVEMRSVLVLLASLLSLSLLASPVSAQRCYIMPPPAPDMCGPGFYCTNQCGMVYGPNYCVRPCFQPFQGMMIGPPNKGGQGMGAYGPGGVAQGGPGGPPPGGPGMGAYGPGGGTPGGPTMYGANPGSLGFPSHLYARSLRDYFMVDVDPANSPYTYGASSPLYGPSSNGGNGILPVPE
jgi:hypothetical protein